MDAYRKITFWQNFHRRDVLNRFKNQLQKYFSIIDYHPYGDIFDNNDSYPLREYLNRHVGTVREYLQEAGITMSVIRSAPAFAGGRRSHVDLLDDLFVLHQYDINWQTVVDGIDRGLGTYESDFQRSVLRTFSPFFWLSLALEFVSSIPFYLLGSLGLDRSMLERSGLGKALKWLIKCVTLFTTLWQFLIFVGVVPQTLSVLALLGDIHVR
jgi:hypothetical protein